MDNRYFLIKHGPVWDQFLIDRNERIKAEKEIKAFMKLIGADNAWGNGPDSYCFGFKGERAREVRNSKLWVEVKHIRGAYRPSKKTKGLEEIRKAISCLPKYGSLNDCLRVVDLHPGFPSLIENSRGYSPHVRFYSIDDKVMIVQMPWKNIDPKEMEQYKIDHAAGRHSSARMEYLQWLPHQSMKEIKEWEALKLIDELHKPEQ